MSLLCLTSSRAADPLSDEGIHGGLVVQLGATDIEEPIRLSLTGRYVIHILDSNPKAVERAQNQIRKNGFYGLAFSEVTAEASRLPYSENVVNAVVLGEKTQAELSEVLRVLTPRGTLFVPLSAGLNIGSLEAAGFDSVSEKEDGSFVAKKPWPESMDTWSHARHAADGNAVSQDTAVGPPERVRWVAAAMSEVEGLVSQGGRNFYGGVLARDSFNGLRLWHKDLDQGELNDPSFDLPRLSYERARPVASGKYLFAVADGNLVALDAATGETVRKYEGIGEPNEIIHHRDVVVAVDDDQVRAFSTETAAELWHEDAAEGRNLSAFNDTVSLIRGRPKRGEKSEAMALDIYSGEIKWTQSSFPWLDKVYRIVMHGEQMAFEVSSLSDHDSGNGIHIVDSETGELAWEMDFSPGMNHRRQARAMFSGGDLWVLHGGKENTENKETMTKVPIQVSALDPKTGETKKTFPAGMAHCFPPVATPKFVMAGVLDMTNMETGETIANQITKANCSRENGWVPANGLIYTTPKHCTCWPMLRGFVAMAPAREDESHAAEKLPLDRIEFAVTQGTASVDPASAAPGEGDWPTYRGDRWRSASSKSSGPGALVETIWNTKLYDSGSLPEGPVMFDWKENPYVKGPVTAPTIANGRVYVARSDAHEVVSLDSGTGDIVWRFTARGRVDTPPTIHRGLALFGCHAGYVYAVSAATGELVWQFQAAPVDERIVAYGQVESAWPVPGAVLVRNETAYFVAGRQQLADGGVLVFAIDPMTGEKEWVHRIDSIPHKADPTGENPFQGFYENTGLEFDPVDILHEEGDGIAMSRWILSNDGKDISVDKMNAFAMLDTGAGAVWVPRGSWTYGARHQDRFKGEAPRRPLVAFRDGSVYGQLNGSTDVFRRDFDSESVESFASNWITGWEASKRGRIDDKPFRSYRVAEGAKWTVDPFASAEVKAKPFKAGEQIYNDIHAMALDSSGHLYAVHKDGRLKVFDAGSGEVLGEREVPAPMWDGLAIANGKLYLTTLAGELICLGGD